MMINHRSVVIYLYLHCNLSMYELTEYFCQGASSEPQCESYSPFQSQERRTRADLLSIQRQSRQFPPSLSCGSAPVVLLTEKEKKRLSKRFAYADNKIELFHMSRQLFKGNVGKSYRIRIRKQRRSFKYNLKAMCCVVWSVYSI